MDAVGIARTLVPLVALAFSVAAIVLAFGFPGMRERTTRVSQQLKTLELALAQVSVQMQDQEARVSMQAAIDAELWTREEDPEAFVDVPNALLATGVRAVENSRQDELVRWLGRTLQCVSAWSMAAAVPEAALPGVAALQSTAAELQQASSLDAVERMEDSIQSLLPGLLTRVVSQTDREEARRSAEANRDLRALSEAMVTKCNYVLIDPAPGSRLRADLHTSLELQRAGTASQHGTVARVLCRGLQRHNGELVQRAEVIEYD